MSKNNVLQFKVINPKRLVGKNKKLETETVQIFKTKGHRITEKEIETLVKKFQTKEKERPNGKKTTISVNGLNGDRYRNLKNFDEEDVHVQTYEEYNQGVEFESDNFMEFYQLNITFHRLI
jgi:uncharacterized membrane protein